eukprot:TRINITY_DN13843_c0_g1_i1.p1 TRINITY_DN13843_c0_g1~~TRINITY_DN13843_c0_g1_i1.p1  ORF type:complete len:197 (+),score=72.22 TRINITY_DN13843_c0_g1_i1:57-647(+)
MDVRAEAQLKDHSTLVPRFEAMKAERSKWQQQIADLKLQVNCLTRDSEDYKKSHKELKDLRDLVQNSNNPKHQIMAKVAHLENENKELLEQNALFQRERDEAKSELAYMQGRLNEWTYYQNEGKPAPGSPALAPDSPVEAPASPEAGAYFGDRFSGMLEDHEKKTEEVKPKPVIKNSKMNFGANLGAKDGTWFKGK